MDNRKFTANKLYCILRLLGNFALAFTIPTCVIYLRCYGVEIWQIATLSAAFEGTILIFELPTGGFADVFGRKTSMQLAKIFQAISALVYAISRGFHGFLIAEIIMGIGEAFMSGSLDAWLIDTLKYQKRESDIKIVLSNGLRFSQIGFLAGASIGGVLGGYAITLIWYPVAALHLIGLVVVTTFMRETYFI